MDSLVDRIQQTEVCGSDLKAGNAMAALALAGFRNYDLMREAGCDKDVATEEYCFAEAGHEITPDSSYF